MSYSPNFRGSQSEASSRQLITNYQNISGSDISQGTPVSADSSGNIFPTDITSETSVESLVGYAYARIANGTYGPVISGGRLENIIISFNVGSPLWVNYDGTLTNVRPDLSVPGWALGMFTIFVGVVVVNEKNALEKDIQLVSPIIGEF